jgi:hypothetical protein
VNAQRLHLDRTRPNEAPVRHRDQMQTVVEVIPVKASALARRRILVVLLSLTPLALDSVLGSEYKGLLLLPLICSDRTDLSTTIGHRPDNGAEADGEQIVELHVSVVFFGVLFLNSMSSAEQVNLYKSYQLAGRSPKDSSS